MTAAAGTIPSLPQYQPGALPLAGTEALEIVNTTVATSALSYFILLTDLVGKAPGAMAGLNPQTSDLLAFYRPGTGLYFSTPIGNLAIPGGNLPVAGGTGQFLQKNSSTDYDASWVNISASIAGQTSVVTITGSTSLVIGLATAGIGSTQLGTNVVQSINLATSAVIATSIAAGTINSSHLSNNAIFSSAIATGQVGSTQLGAFAVQAGNIATSAIGSTQLGAFAVQAGNVATNVIGNTQLRQGSGLSVVGVTGTATANVADIVAAVTTAVVLGIGANGTSLGFTAAPILGTSLVVGTTTVTAATGSIVANTFLESIGGFKRASANFTTATTTLANITGLTVALLTNTAYQFDACLFATAGSTGGTKVAVAYTGTATTSVYEMVAFNTTLLTEIYTTSLNAALTVATAATTPCIRITGSIVASTAGTLAIQIAQQASTTTSTIILAGSTLRVFQMA